MKSAMQYRKFIDEPTMSDKTLLVSVEDLINTAFGTVEQNIVNFKLVQTVLHILARQMRLLEQDVEIKFDELADKPRGGYDDRGGYEDEQQYTSTSAESRDQMAADGVEGEDRRGRDQRGGRGGDRGGRGGDRGERDDDRGERGGGGREGGRDRQGDKAASRDREEKGATKDKRASRQEKGASKERKGAKGADRGADAAEKGSPRGRRGRKEGGGAGRDDDGGQGGGRDDAGRDDARGGGGRDDARGYGGGGGGGRDATRADARDDARGGAGGGQSKDRGGQKAGADDRGGGGGGGKKGADRGRKGTPESGRSTGTSAARSGGREGSRTSITVSEATRRGGKGPKDKILVVEKGPTARGGRVARVGSIEVVTASQFALLEKAVNQLANVAGPLPMPALPDNERLRQDLAQGRASLSETMQAMQLTARIQAAEQGLTRMAELLTQLAAAGALPEEMAGQIGQVRDQLQQAVTAVADAVGQAGGPGMYVGGPGMGPGGVGPGYAGAGMGPGGVGPGYAGAGMGPGGVGPGYAGAGVGPGYGGPGMVPGGVDQGYGGPGMGPGGVGPEGVSPGYGGPGMGPGGVGPGLGPGGVGQGYGGPGMGPGGVGPGMGPGGVGPGMGPGGVGPWMGPGGAGQGYGGPGMGPGGVGPGMGPGGVGQGYGGPGMGPDGVFPGMGPGGVGQGYGGPGMGPDGVFPGMGPGGMGQGYGGPGMGPGGVGPGGVGPGYGGPGMGQGGVGPGYGRYGGGTGTPSIAGGVGPESYATGASGPGRKSVAIDPMSSRPESVKRGDGSGGTARASVGARRPSEVSAAAGPAGPGGALGVTHPEMENVIQIMRSELIKEITAMTTRATHSADIASNTSKSVADKLDVALNIDKRISKLFSLANDYAEQLSGFDSGLTTQMASFQEQMSQMRTDLKGGIQQLEQANNNAETAAILELTERYEGLVIELDNTLHTHQSLTVLQKQLSDELRSLVECVEMLREQKADRDEVLDGLRDKADITRLAGLLHEGDFAHAREELEKSLEHCYDKFKKQDEIWLGALKDLSDITESKAEIIQLLAIKDTATDELRKIQETLRELYIMLGEPKAAILMRMLAKGAACGSCLAPALMEPQDINYGRPHPLPALRPPPDGQEPCAVILQPLPPPDARQHVCRRWVGGSHTLVGGPVTRERAVADSRATPTKRFTGYGTDGRLYMLEEELQPCLECNKLSTDEQEGDEPLPTPTGGGGDQAGGATPIADDGKGGNCGNHFNGTSLVSEPLAQFSGQQQQSYR